MKRILQTTLLSISLAAAGCATQQAAEKPAPSPKPAPVASAKVKMPAPKPKPVVSFRDHQPGALARKVHFDAPVPVKKTLKNGLTVLIHENHRLPLVAVDMVIETGTDADPQGKAGLAYLTVNMLNEGTKHYSSLKMAQAMQDQAIELTAMGVKRDHAIVGISALKKTLPQGLDLLAEMIEHPAFRSHDVRRVRTNVLGQLVQKQGQARPLADDAMQRALFGKDHPWGQPQMGTLASMKSIRAANLKKFWKSWYRPNNAVLTVSGDVNPAELMKAIEHAFGHWKPHALPKLQQAAFPALHRGVVLVPVAHSSQSQVWVGTRLNVKETDPDAVPLEVANEILGGMFSSRLNMDLREARGYSYGVRSRLQFEPTASVWFAAGGIVADKTAPAVGEYVKQMTQFASGEVSAKEVEMAKKGLINVLPAEMESNRAIAGLMAEIAVEHLPLDFFQTLPGKIEAVTQADVKRVVTQYLEPEAWPIIVAGPAKYADALGKLGYGKVTLQPAEAKTQQPTARK